MLLNTYRDHGRPGARTDFSPKIQKYIRGRIASRNAFCLAITDQKIKLQ